MSQLVRKPKILVLGCGWSGFRFAKDINKKLYDVEVISPRNHFLFTPLLPSTAVGTLEFRCIQEPIRTIPSIQYTQASCTKINIEDKSIDCLHSFDNTIHQKKFDYLVIAAGAETATFGVPGVNPSNPNISFLKQLSDSRKIRNHLLDCFERAAASRVGSDEFKRLLTFVVVGGGPTNIEFASELYDFIKEDATRWYPDLYQHVQVVVIEASNHILGTFKESLSGYVEKLFKSRRINVLLNKRVVEVKEHSAILDDKQELQFGLMVWSTGIKQTSLIQNLPKEILKTPNGRLQVDKQLRILTSKSVEQGKDRIVPAAEGTVFAMGDCAADTGRPLPALAQVAMQQGKYLAKAFNKNTIHTSEFAYSHLGSMASVGEWKGVFDSTSLDKKSAVGPPVQGFLAFALWRSAYWTKSVSIVNKMLIPMYWFKSAVFGRDISIF